MHVYKYMIGFCLVSHTAFTSSISCEWHLFITSIITIRLAEIVFVSLLKIQM